MADFAGIRFGVSDDSVSLIRGQLEAIAADINKNPIKLSFTIDKSATTETQQLNSALSSTKEVLKESAASAKGAAEAKRILAVETARAVAQSKVDAAASKAAAAASNATAAAARAATAEIKQKAAANAADAASSKAAASAETQHQNAVNRLALAQKQLSIWGQNWSQMKFNPVLSSEYAVLTKRVNDLLSSSTATTGQMNDLSRQVTMFGARCREAGVNVMSLGDKFKASFAKFSVWLSASAIMMKLVRQLKRVVTSVTELDKEMVTLAKVSGATDVELEGYLDRASEKAVKLKVSLSDLTEAVGLFARLGYNLKDSEMLGQVAVIFKNVGDDVDSIEDSANAIVSAMKANNCLCAQQCVA